MPFPSVQENKVHGTVSSRGRMRVAPVHLHRPSPLQANALPTCLTHKSHHPEPPTVSGVGLLQGHLWIISPSGSPCRALQPTVPLYQRGRVSRGAVAPGEGTCFSNWAWREFQHLWLLSTYILMCQHQQWAGRGGVLSLASGLGTVWPTQGSAVSAAQACQLAPVAPAQRCAGWCRQGQEGPSQAAYGASSFSVTGHYIPSGHRPIAGFTFLSVMFKTLITGTTNNAWLHFELADLSLNHQILVGFTLWNEQPDSSHPTGTHTFLKHLILDKLNGLSSLSSHLNASSPAFLTSYHVSSCNNTCVVSTESGSSPGIWKRDFQMSLRNLSGLNLI